jgi:hypothetical protein
MARGRRRRTSRCPQNPSLRPSPPPPLPSLSGWLFILDDSGRKKHRYYVLCPTYLAYFTSEDHAAITEEGFMAGDADSTSLSAFGGSAGASIALANIYSAEPDPIGEAFFALTFRQALDDGTNTMTLHCANKEIAAGWSGAIMGQVASATAGGGLIAPPREKPPPMTVEEKVRGTGMMAMQSLRNLGSGGAGRGPAGSGGGGGGGGGGGWGGSLLGMLTGKSSEEPARQDSEYFNYTPWDDKGIDLQSKEGKNCIEDELGHPAAIMHGWLSKKNKSGLRVGQVEKDRYFVLTPEFLGFFPDEKTAAIKDGYMYGKAQGDKIGGLFEKTGARLPLESVCEVKLLARLDDSNAIRRMNSGKSSGSRRSADEEEDEDEDEEESPRPKKGGAKAKGKAAAKKGAAKKGGKKGGSDDDESEEEEEDGSDDDSDDEKAKKKKAKAKAKAKAAKAAAEEDEDEDDGKKKKKTTKKKAKGSDDEDDEDDEDEGSKPKRKPSGAKPSGSKPSGAKPAGSKPSGAGAGKPSSSSSSSSAAAASALGSPLRPDGPPPSNLIEIDFGEFSLIVNARNQQNRTAWVRALRKWSGWRKRMVDEDMFASMGQRGFG